MLENGLIRKAKVNLKIYDVTDWQTNNFGTHTNQYVKKKT